MPLLLLLLLRLLLLWMDTDVLPCSFCSLDRCSVNTAYHVVFFGQDAASLTSSREQDMVHTQLARKTTPTLHTDLLLLVLLSFFPSFLLSFFPSFLLSFLLLLQDANILSIVQHAQNGQPVPLVRGVDSDALEDFQSIMGLTCMVKQTTTTTTTTTGD